MKGCCLVLLLACAGCNKLRGQKPAPSASATIVSAPTTIPLPQDAGAHAVVDAGVDSGAHANVERAKETLADIQWMVTHRVTVNRKKPGDGDITTKCEEIEKVKSSPAASDAEMKKVLEEAEAVCAFDVPLLTASEALDHLQGMPSQASRILTCSAAGHDLDKARAVKPKDRKLLGLDARRRQLCNK